MTTGFSEDGHKKKSINADTWAMLEVARREGIETVWDRLEKQQPQCGFCNLGTSCRICAMGPCRVDPFGEGPQKGVCGADADIIVARNLARMVAAGASSHSDHGRDILETLHRVGESKTDIYTISEPAKMNDTHKMPGPSAKTLWLSRGRVKLKTTSTSTANTNIEATLSFVRSSERRSFRTIAATVDRKPVISSP